MQRCCLPHPAPARVLRAGLNQRFPIKELTHYALSNHATRNGSRGAVLRRRAGGAGMHSREPKTSWMPEADMKAKIEAGGYKIKLFLVSGSCYEIYDHDKDAVGCSPPTPSGAADGSSACTRRLPTQL